jgi:hypothetical protein
VSVLIIFSVAYFIVGLIYAIMNYRTYEVAGDGPLSLISEFVIFYLMIAFWLPIEAMKRL